jgi:hypothetical protein
MKTFIWGLFALLLAGCGQGFQSASLEENSPDFSSAALATQIVTNGASFNFKSFSAAPAPAPIETYSPTSVNFGTVNVGQSSAIQTLTFKNTGSSNLVLSSVALNENFGWGPATSTICSMNTAYAPGSSCTMAIFFSPQSAGSLSGSLTVMDNTSNSTKVIQLAGVGASVSPSPSSAPAPAPAPAPSPSPSPSSILLTNGSFETALSSWSMYLNNSAIGTFLRDSSSAAPNKGIASGLISVTQSFGNIWDVGIVSESMHPTVGQQYSVSFYAKADSSGRQLMASISQSYSPFGQYFTKQFTLSTTWQQYTFTFTQPVNDSVALVLASGAQNGKVSLDAISFTAGASTPSPSPTPTPSPALSPSKVPAPTGGLITNFTPERYNQFQIDGVPYSVLTVNKSYNLEQIDNHTLRFEIQQGDSVWCCNNETSLIERQQKWEPGTPLTIAYQFMLEPGAANTANWFVLAEIQTDFSNSPFPKASASPVVTIGLGGPTTAPWSGGEHLQVWSQWCPTNLSPANGAGNVKNQILWSQPTDIVRGKWYDIRIQTTIINSSAGHLNVWIDGTQVVNYSGPVGFGHPNYFLYGVYRHTSPQNTAAQFKNMTISPSP